LDSSYSYNLDLVEAILFDILVLVTPNNPSLLEDIVLSKFYPEIPEIQNWTMELWDHLQDNQGKSRMYYATALQQCFELLKTAWGWFVIYIFSENKKEHRDVIHHLNSFLTIISFILMMILGNIQKYYEQLTHRELHLYSVIWVALSNQTRELLMPTNKLFQDIAPCDLKHSFCFLILFT